MDFANFSNNKYIDLKFAKLVDQITYLDAIFDTYFTTIRSF